MMHKIFKIGVGPSSSHTYAPMKICYDYVKKNKTCKTFDITLYGSLAFTGKGHKTDQACILGCNGYKPDTIVPNIAKDILGRPNEHIQIHFDYSMHKAHPNTMVINDETFMSTGGGFYKSLSESQNNTTNTDPLLTTQMLRDQFNESQSWESIVPFPGITSIIETMENAIQRGLVNEDPLVNLKRRAPKMYNKLIMQKIPKDDTSYLPIYAMAVNEENAGSWGQIVTAPTNGASGVIPAIMQYVSDKELFLRVCSAFGYIIKTNASISGAESGCMGEVGSASAMAAAGLTACNGGTFAQIENAAEIAMEHSLGLTCDPVDGLVQIPCIERNAMGAIKAYHSSKIALMSSESGNVSFDEILQVVNDTAKNMREEYKETSLGGMAKILGKNKKSHPIC